MNTEHDEPLSPGGRLFVQPATHQVINTAFGLEHTIEPDALLTAISDSLVTKHPRFSSLLVTDSHGREHWRKVKLNIRRHIIVRPDPVGEGDNNEEIVNDYLADLAVSYPLNVNKPLWEFHLLTAHKCVVMRVHHALGDGISIVSLGITMCRRLDDPEQTPTIEHLVSSTQKAKKPGRLEKVWKVLKLVWFSLMYAFEFIMRAVWVKDGKTVVRGGEGVELWPRKIATAKFSLQDMKTVKSVVTNATINDVLFGVISSGLSKYLDSRSPDSIQEGFQITGVAIVNLRPSPGLKEMKELMKKNAGTAGWGNKVGFMLLPVYYHRNRSDPLQYLKRAKMMMDRKKLSMEAFLSHHIGCFLMKFFGAKFASSLSYRVACNTSFTFSNVVGPRDEMTVAGIPIKYIRTTISSLPHAIIMHIMSYAGKADMQILVVKDLIPDPEKLAKCFEDALLEMKEYAVQI